MDGIWRWGNLAVAFGVEIAGLGIFAWWGWRTGDSLVLRLLLAIGLPLIAAVVWGLFAAPTANYGSPAVTAIVKVAFFGLAGLALWSLDHRVVAATFVLIVAVNLIIIRAGNLNPDTPAATSTSTTVSR
jgi:hypothetical protein